jgi:hypothetical protein
MRGEGVSCCGEGMLVGEAVVGVGARVAGLRDAGDVSGCVAEGFVFVMARVTAATGRGCFLGLPLFLLEFRLEGSLEMGKEEEKIKSVKGSYGGCPG